MHIVVVCGTNRKGSLSRTLAQRVVENYEQLDVSVDLLDMGEVTADFVVPTAYKEQPETVSKMVNRFLAADGVVFIVPEYNGSYPGIVKLFIDMLPYPEGFDRRPCAFIGLAAGEFKGLRAVEHLQHVAGYRMAHVFPRRCFIGGSYGQFDESGQLKDDSLRERLQNQAVGFKDFIERVGSPNQA